MSKIPGRPFLTESFSPRGGGIDFLGMRAVNLRILQDYLIPGINNATADFGTYCLAAWIPWKFAELAHNKQEFTLSNYRRFRETVEIAIAYAQRADSPANERFGSPRTRIGVQQQVDLSKPLTFAETKRTDATSLFAAPLYGPSLKYLQLILGDAVAVDGTSTRIPITANDDITSLLVHEVDSALKESAEYQHFNHTETPTLASDSLDDLGLHGFHPAYYRSSRAEVKRAFLQKFLGPKRANDSADYRRLTARLICETARQHAFRSASELRACWYTGLLPTGESLRLPDDELRAHRSLWALFQFRQIQRTIAELFLRCFELGLKAGAESIEEVVRYWNAKIIDEFYLGHFATLSDFIRSEIAPVRDHGTYEELGVAWQEVVHGEHELYDDIEEGTVDGEFARAFRMLARWWIRLRPWTKQAANAEILGMGERSRMSIRWFSAWINDRLSYSLESVASEIFSEIVFAQHIKVALSRFDGQVQRLRFTLGDSGMIPTTAAAKKLGGRPVRMADRLQSFMGLLCDLDLIDWPENGAIALGAEVDLLAELGGHD